MHGGEPQPWRSCASSSTSTSTWARTRCACAACRWRRRPAWPRRALDAGIKQAERGRPGGGHGAADEDLGDTFVCHGIKAVARDEQRRWEGTWSFDEWEGTLRLRVTRCWYAEEVHGAMGAWEEYEVDSMLMPCRHARARRETPNDCLYADLTAFQLDWVQTTVL